MDIFRGGKFWVGGLNERKQEERENKRKKGCVIGVEGKGRQTGYGHMGGCLVKKGD